MKTPRILIADDDKVFLADISKFLKNRLNADFSVFSDGTEAYQHVAQEIYDVILTDYRMSGADGIEILKLAKKRDPQQEVFVMTGTHSLSDEIEPLGGLFIAKPLCLKVVQKLIEQVLDQKGGFDYKKR